MTIFLKRRFYTLREKLRAAFVTEIWCFFVFLEFYQEFQSITKIKLVYVFDVCYFVNEFISQKITKEESCVLKFSQK